MAEIESLSWEAELLSGNSISNQATSNLKHSHCDEGKTEFWHFNTWHNHTDFERSGRPSLLQLSSGPFFMTIYNRWLTLASPCIWKVWENLDFVAYIQENGDVSRYGNVS